MSAPVLERTLGISEGCEWCGRAFAPGYVFPVNASGQPEPLCGSCDEARVQTRIFAAGLLSLRIQASELPPLCAADVEESK